MDFIGLELIETGEFLDLYPDTEINFEVENDLLATELAIATFAPQFKIPASEGNLKKLGFVNVVQADVDLQKEIPIRVHMGGIPYKKGRLINVNNTNYSESNYLEYGFVGDKANIRLDDKLSTVLEDVSVNVPHTEVNVCRARFDLLFPTVDKYKDLITNAFGSAPSNWQVKPGLVRCGITLESNTGDFIDVSIEYAPFGIQLGGGTYNNDILTDIVDQLNSNSIFSAQAIAVLESYSPKDPNTVSDPTPNLNYLKTYINAFNPSIYGIITIIPKVNATKKLTITWVYRRYEAYQYNSSTGVYTLLGTFNENIPFAQFPKRNFDIWTWWNNIESDATYVFPQMIASRVYDDLGTAEDDSFDVYAGQNNYFSKKGEKYDPAKTYPQSSAIKPVYVEFGDPINYYVSTAAVNENEDPISTPSKWLELPSEQFINEWGPGGYYLRLDNEVYASKIFRFTILPCLFLKQILVKIFESFVVPFAGEVLSNTDFEKLILVWNKTLDSIGSTEFPRDTPERRTLLQNVTNYYWNNYQSEIKMADYLPDFSVKEFLQEVRNCLGIGFLFENDACEMVFFETVLNSAPVNYTEKAVKGIVLKKDEYKGITFITERDEDINVAAQGIPFYKYQYEEDSVGEEVTTTIGTLVQGQTVGGYAQAPAAFQPYRIPLFGSKFSTAYYKAENAANLKVLWYYGPAQDGVRYATSTRLGPTGNTNLFPFTLDKTALFFRYWPTWAKWKKESKYVKMLFKLELADLLHFTFKQKIQVENQNYLVKKMNFKATMQGLTPVQFEMYSINN